MDISNVAPLPGDVGERYLRWRRWRWPVLGFVIAAQLAAVVVSVTKAASSDLLADLSAGRVRSVYVSSFEKDPRVGFSVRPIDEQQDRTSRSGVRWVTSYGLHYQTDLQNVGFSGNVAFDHDNLDVRATIRATARAAEVAAPRVVTGEPTALYEGLVMLAAFASWVLAVMLLIGGPEPRMFTRWGTFWLFNLPGGVGIIWWLLREAPWDEEMSALPPLANRQTGSRADGGLRRGGWMGLVLLVVLFNIVYGVLALGLSTATNHHPGGGVVWQLVDDKGHHATGEE